MDTVANLTAQLYEQVYQASLEPADEHTKATIYAKTRELVHHFEMTASQYATVAALIPVVIAVKDHISAGLGYCSTFGMSRFTHLSKAYDQVEELIVMGSRLPT